MLTRPRVAASKNNLALLRRHRNETDIARQIFLECEQIYTIVYGPHHRETVEQSGKLRLVFVCDDAAQITKISKKQQKNICLPSSAHGHDGRKHI